MINTCMNEPDDKLLNELIQEVNSQNNFEFDDFGEFDEITRIAKKSKSTQDTRIHIENILSEFLPCYRIMGFDIHGNEINIESHQNSMEKGALDNMFVSEFSKLMSNNKQDEWGN